MWVGGVVGVDAYTVVEQVIFPPEPKKVRRKVMGVGPMVNVLLPDVVSLVPLLQTLYVVLLLVHVTVTACPGFAEVTSVVTLQTGAPGALPRNWKIPCEGRVDSGAPLSQSLSEVEATPYVFGDQRKLLIGDKAETVPVVVASKSPRSVVGDTEPSSSK